MPRTTTLAAPIVAAWALLLAGLTVGTNSSCDPLGGDDLQLVGVGLLLAGAVLAYLGVVLLIWPVRRSGDVQIMAGAAVLTVVSAPFLGVGLVAPLLVAYGYALARLIRIDGPARPRFLLLFSLAAAWNVAAVYAFVRIAFDCGLF